jgi:hypothetical protein
MKISVPDRTALLPILLHVKRDRVFFLGFKVSVRGFIHPNSSSGNVKVRVEVKLFSISGHSGLLMDEILF